MLKVSKAKLEAYKKALHAENNCVMLYMVGNRKQFDVYGTYYVKRKVNCARGVKVYKDVKTVGWHKVSQKEVAEILENYGLTVDEFVAIANGEYEEETAEAETVTANEEVTAEDDGSNDDDYDEDEIVTVDNTDNYDDDDELVDLPESEEKTLYEYGMTSDRPLFGLLPKGYLYLFKGNLHIRRIGYFHYTFCYETPLTDDVINNLDLVDITAQKNALEARKYTANKVTAEVKEETKMKEIKVPEASTTTETAKFEVGKVYHYSYYPNIEVVKIVNRTAKMVGVEKLSIKGDETTYRFKIKQNNDGSEYIDIKRGHITIGISAKDEYTAEMAAHMIEKYSFRNTAYLPSVMNINSILFGNKTVTADEEVTAEVENVTAEEVTEETTAEVEKLEKKLASLKLFPLNTDEYMQACVYSIKKHYACIAKAEEDMWKFQLEKEKYEREVAELENEIANRKIVDAIDDIGGSADAVNATVEAMIELNSANFTAIFNDVENNFTTANLLNSANDFTTANLLDAINAADKAVENVPVTFEIQNFAADVNIAEGVATIDTLISGTVIPVIDETAAIDSKVNRLRAEYADLEAQICELRKKQLAISREFSDLTYENESEVSQRLRAPALAKNLFEHGLMIYPQKGEWRRDYIWVENDIEWQELKIGTAKSVDGGYKFVTNDADGYEKEEIAVYSTLTQFKAAFRELVAAIERGDEKFTFPADIPPATELPDSDAEIAKQIWF